VGVAIKDGDHHCEVHNGENSYVEVHRFCVLVIEYCQTVFKVLGKSPLVVKSG